MNSVSITKRSLKSAIFLCYLGECMVKLQVGRSQPAFGNPCAVSKLVPKGLIRCFKNRTRVGFEPGTN